MKELINSEKTVEVAVLPLLRLDIQYFSDEGESVDTTTDVDTTTETDAETDPGTETEQIDDTSETNQEVADPDVEPSFKDDPQNQAFAQMRRQAEQAEARAQHADELIARQYGESHGIYSVEQYEQALQREQYAEMGIDPDQIEKIVDEKLESHPTVVEARKQAEAHRLLTSFNELQGEYKDLVKTPEDVPVEVWQRWDNGESGLSLTEAFELANKQAIRDHLQASTKQSTLNKINSKEHIRGNGGEVSGDVDITSVPAETMQQYRMMFKKELRTGKMSESDFVKHYKNSTKG